MTLRNTLTATALLPLLFQTQPTIAAAANLPPTFTPIAAKSVAEGAALSFTVNATDPEGSSVTLTATGLKTWMSFSNKVFTANPSLSNSGTYTVNFTATDTSGRKSTLKVTITVTNTNQAPTFAAISAKTMSEGGTLSFSLTATDPDLDKVTISAASLKSWMTFDGKTLTAKPGYSDSGTHSITFSASDGKASSSAVATLTVNNVNQAPVFSTGTTQNVAENANLTLPVLATDPDGDPVTLTVTGLKPWMSFNGTSLTATPGYDDAEAYPLTFTASDGSKQTKLYMTLNVTDTNRTPSLTPPGQWKIGVGKVLSLPMKATDPDGDTLTLSAAGLLPWMSFDGQTFRAYPGGNHQGQYHINIVANDGKATSTQTLTLNIDAEGGSFPPVWKDYFGSVGSAAGWATWTRNSLYSLTGMGLVNDPSGLDDLVNVVGDNLENYDTMVPAVGFSADRATDLSMLKDFLSLVHDGGVVDYQAAIRSQVESLSPLDPAAQRIYYQMGNEITRDVFSIGIREWAAARGISISGAAMEYDPELIAYYVEYHVAPTVEAILSASESAYGDPEAVTIVLGSIGNGASAAAQEWLDMLLDYTVQGTFAPSLAGKKVNELIDLISVHYVGGGSGLAPMWDKWNGVGTIRGIWSTEEVGHKAAEEGRAAGRTVKAVSDYLNWYYENGFDQTMGRVSFYEWEMNGPAAGTSTNEVMNVYDQFFGETPLEVRTTGLSPVGDSGEFFAYAYQSLNDGDKRALAVLRSGSSNAVLREVLFDKAGWTGSATAEIHVFSAAGHVIVAAQAVENADYYRIVLPSPVTLVGDGDAVLINVQR